MGDSVRRLFSEGIELVPHCVCAQPKDVGGRSGRLDVGVAKALPGNSLRQDRWQVGLVEDANKVRHLALQRNCQPKHRQKVRELDSNLHRTHVSLWDAYALGEPLLTQPALQSHFPKVRPEQFAGYRFVF